MMVANTQVSEGPVIYLSLMTLLIAFCVLTEALHLVMVS